MEKRIGKVIQEAETMLDDAQFLLTGNRYGSAVNRAYYAVFHCVQSLLQSKEILVKTHAGTRSKFGELFIKTGILPKSLGEQLEKLESYRTIADYSYDNEISSSIAAKAVISAVHFLEQTKLYFENLEDMPSEDTK
ncbi:MAG: HEPN domain-containing protein [Bacteroidota bacterium]